MEELQTVSDHAVLLVLFFVLLLLLSWNTRLNDGLFTELGPLIVVFSTVILFSVLSGYKGHTIVLIGTGALVGYALWYCLVNAAFTAISWFFAALGRLLSRR